MGCVDQFAFRYPTRQVLMPTQTTWSGNQRLLMFARLLSSCSRTSDEYKKYEYENGFAYARCGSYRQRYRAIGNRLAVFLAHKIRACQANQKKLGVDGSVNNGLQYR